MKIFLAQQNYHIGNFEYNTNKIIEAKNNKGETLFDMIVKIINIHCLNGKENEDKIELYLK
mgnify:CR=1 FL=1